MKYKYKLLIFLISLDWIPPILTEHLYYIHYIFTERGLAALIEFGLLALGTIIIYDISYTTYKYNRGESN